jgi:hypothetical protein
MYPFLRDNGYENHNSDSTSEIGKNEIGKNWLPA